MNCWYSVVETLLTTTKMDRFSSDCNFFRSCDLRVHWQFNVSPRVENIPSDLEMECLRLPLKLSLPIIPSQIFSCDSPVCCCIPSDSQVPFRWLISFSPLAQKCFIVVYPFILLHFSVMILLANISYFSSLYLTWKLPLGELSPFDSLCLWVHYPWRLEVCLNDLEFSRTNPCIPHIICFWSVCTVCSICVNLLLAIASS